MTEFTKFATYFLYGNFLFDASYQVLLLSSVVCVITWYLLSQSPKRNSRLTKEQEEEYMRNWKPEALVPDLIPDPYLPKKRIIRSKAGKYIDIDGQRCLNFATHNYLGLTEDKVIEERAVSSISKYGVGSCGPRGFYGTVDVHLDLEENLAKFMQVEEACVYAYGFSTIASAIPAYCKRGDIIFVDEAVCFAIQKGLDAARSDIRFFKHNDMDDLKNLLEQQVLADKKNPRKAAKTRKFIIVEGIYFNTGNICNLPKLVELRREYKVRMFIDESVSFGTLGKNGRGVLEHFDIPTKEVDLRIGSLENAMSSIGGFSCGASFIVEHQRLSGLGYCFSASLPPVLAVAALTALDHLNQNPQLVEKLNKASINLHQELSNLDDLIVSGHPLSPIKHVYLKNISDEDLSKKKLNDIVDYCIDNKVAFVRPNYLENAEKTKPKPSLRITANALLCSDDISLAIQVLQNACKQYL